MTKYSAVHRQLRIRRGRATEHRCAQCRDRAAEWSYTGDDPNQLVELRTPFGGAPRPVPYSLDLALYRPLCTPCHRRADGTPSIYTRTSAVDLRKPAEWTGRRQRCSCCEMTKDCGAFALDRARPIGRQTRCRACNARYQAALKAERGLRKQSLGGS